MREAQEIFFHMNRKSEHPEPLRNQSRTSVSYCEHSRSRSRLSVSDVGGLTWDEISCDESDDLLPKTDYTYAKTASYSPRYIRKKRYRSPNMSRRKMRGGNPSFLSDDEDDEDFIERFNTGDTVITSNMQTQNFEIQSPQPIGPELQARQRQRSEIVTSTPLVPPFGENQISAHDHYYDGMLLRSGSHVKGMKGYLSAGGRKSRRSEGDALLSQAALRSDLAMESTGRRRSSRNITTVTTITTTTTEEERMREKERLAMEENELKLKLDESQTEKDNVYTVTHFNGLDSDEDFSDIDDLHHYQSTRTYEHSSSRQRLRVWSFITTLTTIISTIVTTVFTTASSAVSSVASAASSVASGAASSVASGASSFASSVTSSAIFSSETYSSSSSILGSLLKLVSAPVVLPAKWLWRAVVSTCTWLVTRSTTLILTEIDIKQRRRRGCCCCLLPLLLLLPLALLGGYYSRHLQQEAGIYLSKSQHVLSSSWAYLTAPSESQQLPAYQPPVPVPPVVTTKQEEVHHHHHHHDVDMTEIHQYVQQAILQANQGRTEGLTEQQVRDIVAAMMVTGTDNVKEEVDGNLNVMKGILQGDINSLQAKMSELLDQMRAVTLAHQTMTANLDQTKVHLEGSVGDQRNEWLVASQNLESKLRSLESEIGALKAQMEGLTALITSCCQNNTVVAGSIREEVLAAMAQFGANEDDPTWARLLAALSGQYVARSELDQRLDAVSAEIMERLSVLLAEREKDKATVELQGAVVGGIDEGAVKTIVDEALSQFSADRIGLPDFALESAGGSVLSVRCSETYYRKTALVSVFGIPLWYTSNSPRTVIQPNVHPGECWAFKGQTGYVVIQLSYPIQPTGFTLEHIPRSLSPQGKIESAPKEFAVFGLASESDMQGVNLGNYTYLDNGKPIQYFPIQNRMPGVFQFVELRILGNHGNREYTCVYRFRVHGLV